MRTVASFRWKAALGARCHAAQCVLERKDDWGSFDHRVFCNALFFINLVYILYKIIHQ